MTLRLSRRSLLGSFLGGLVTAVAAGLPSKAERSRSLSAAEASGAGAIPVSDDLLVVTSFGYSFPVNSDEILDDWDPDWDPNSYPHGRVLDLAWLDYDHSLVVYTGKGMWRTYVPPDVEIQELPSVLRAAGFEIYDADLMHIGREFQPCRAMAAPRIQLESPRVGTTPMMLGRA